MDFFWLSCNSACLHTINTLGVRNCKNHTNLILIGLLSKFSVLLFLWVSKICLKYVNLVILYLGGHFFPYQHCYKCKHRHQIHRVFKKGKVWIYWVFFVLKIYLLDQLIKFFILNCSILHRLDEIHLSLRFFSLSLLFKSSFLVNSQDRVIRVFNRNDVISYKEGKKEPEPTQKLQDLVNK